MFFVFVFFLLVEDLNPTNLRKGKRNLTEMGESRDWLCGYLLMVVCIYLHMFAYTLMGQK